MTVEMHPPSPHPLRHDGLPPQPPAHLRTQESVEPPAGVSTFLRTEAYELPTRSELPANIATWRADPSRAALLLHDVQCFFLRALPDPTRRALVEHCRTLLAGCRDAGVPVVFTAQPGDMTTAERGLLASFWGSGMSRDPADRAIVPELADRAGDTVLTKWRYSAFHATALAQWLTDHGRDQLILCGVYAHIGVLASAQDAFSRDIETFLVADAVADFSARDHHRALDHAARSCAVVQTTDDLLAQLAPACDVAAFVGGQR